jgi:hypothetical protein
MTGHEAVSELIDSPQYTLSYGQKQAQLLPLLEAQVRSSGASIPAYDSYLTKMRFAREGYQSYLDVPYLPVSVFKSFELCSVPREQVARVLKSSGTTTGKPSRIYLDKTTSFRQTKALINTLKEVLGNQKLPYLVLDCKEINAPGAELTARGAVCRGFMPFASSVTYGLVQNHGNLDPSLPALEEFFATHQDQPVLVSGFTYIILINVIHRLQARGIRFNHPRMTLLHSGGWKSLTELRVEKSAFAAGVADTFGCDPSVVRDFYGMVEQGGVVFIDCAAGNKHTPNFSEVVIRDFLTMKHVQPKESGFIEVLSVLPTSYPGQALLTDDVGTLLGYDDCPCGWRGMYFRFRSRVERSEVRGCGDTFAVSQQLGTSRRVSPTPQPPKEASASPEVIVPGTPAGEEFRTHPFQALRKSLMEDWEEFARLPVGVIVALLDAAANNMVAPKFAGIEGIAFLSSWLRRGNLWKILRTNFGSHLPALNAPLESEGLRLQAMPRGLVCHWVAGNVPTLVMFSWAQAILGKNASILRVPSESRDVVRTLFSAVEQARAEYQGSTFEGSLLMRRTAIVHFPSQDAALGEAMSLVADARVIWGGREAVRTISAYPRMDHCEDVIFGPKFSIGVIDRATVENEAACGATLRAFVRDAVLFEQEACTSPQLLFIEASRAKLEELGDIAEGEFIKISQRHPKRFIAEGLAGEILRTRAHYALQSGTSVRVPPDLSYTVLLEEGVGLRDGLQSRTLFLIAVEDLMGIVPLLSPKIQTLGVAITDLEKRKTFVEGAAVRGVVRSVQPGLMNLYEAPWDGTLPVNRLVRWCHV